MIKLVDARDFLYTAADFWLYAGEVVVATIKVNPRHTPHEYQKRRKDWGVAIAAALPYEQSGSDTNWAGERQLGIPATAVWLTKMGCDPQPIITLAAERGWESEIIAEATEAVEKEKARLVPPVDYLVILLQGGIQSHYVYLPFGEVVAAMQSHCDAELRWEPENGDTISLSDDGEGYKDALAYPLYPPPYSDELVPREKTTAKLTRSWCDGLRDNSPERVKDPTALEILEREIATMMDKLETFARSQGFASLNAALAAASQSDPFRIPVEIRVGITDRAACGGFAPPETPSEWLAWILDETMLQTEQADAAQDHEERQARLKYVTLLKATANRLIKAGVEAAKLPWQLTTLKLSERWRDGLREGLERVIANVEVDTYGVTVMVENAKLEDTSEVLVEFYDGVVKAHIWRAEDYGGDPVESIELFKVEAKEAQHG